MYKSQAIYKRGYMALLVKISPSSAGRVQRIPEPYSLFPMLDIFRGAVRP